MKPSDKLFAIHIFAHIMIIPALIYGEWWMFLVSLCWWLIIAATAISSGYHRYFSHRSFEVEDWYRWFSQSLALFANPGPVLTWASVHRMHHAYNETELDPHSPNKKGFWKVYCSRWGDGIRIKRRFLRGLIDDSSVVFFHRYYFKLMMILALVLFIIHPLVFVFGLAMPIVLAFHGYGMINAYTHKNNTVVNDWIANILTAGEGYHKNHHERPREWMIGNKWYHMDTGSWFIRMIKK